MTHWRTEKGTDIWLVLGGRSNVYLASRGGGYLIVDTGRRSSYRRLKRNLENHGVAYDSSPLLVLTHTHFDHAENAVALKKDYGAYIIVHEAEADFLRKGDSPLPRGTVFFTRIIMRLFTPLVQPRFRYDAARVDFAVSGSLELKDHDFDISLLPVPGHSAGSLAVVIDNEIALVGDAMFGVLHWSILPPFGDDLFQMKKDWGKLLKTGCRLFLPGHGRAINRERLLAALSSPQ